MNCLDITRIANSGSFASLATAERDAAEAHVLTCRHCAPVWATHARLAELRVPPLPAELSLRCRNLAAMPGEAGGRSARRRLGVTGTLLALAAAAGVLLWYQMRPAASSLAVPAVSSVPGTQTTSAAEPAAPPTLRDAGAPAVEANAANADAQSFGPLPRVLRPAAHITHPGQVMPALRKAAERHPELVEGPPLEGNFPFIVALAMRADGTVLSSAVEMPSATTYDEISKRLQHSLPHEAVEPLIYHFDRNQPVSEGRALRARVMLFAAIVPDDFDASRTELRVREILRHKYDEAMLPSRGEEMNLLTVLLSEDGRVLRDRMEKHITPQNADMVLGRGASSNWMADRIALTLGIDPARVGQTGVTSLDEGGTWRVTNPDGTSRMQSTERFLIVMYAWERRSSERAPTRAPVRTFEDDPDIDLAAAQVVVERLLPDAFSHVPRSVNDMSWPTVVFTAKGEVLRAGRVQTRYGVSVDLLLQEQLVPGVHTELHRFVRLTNKAGATANVQFGWAVE